MKCLSFLYTIGQSLWLLVTILLLVTVAFFVPCVFMLLYRPVVGSGASSFDAHLIVMTLWNEVPFSELHLKSGQLGLREVNHFHDVRGILRKLLVFLAFLGPPLVIFYRSISWRIAARGGLAIIVMSSLAMGVWGLINWRNLFRTLHWWIFQDDSWILPQGCITLKLFPYSIWQSLGVMVLVSTIAGLLIIILACYQRKKRVAKK